MAVSPASLRPSVHAIFEEANAVTLTSDNVTVKAIVGYVGHASFEPPVQVLVTRVNRLGPPAEPVHIFGFAREKARLIINRIAVKRIISRINEIIRADGVRIPNVLVYDGSCRSVVLLSRRR